MTVRSFKVRGPPIIFLIDVLFGIQTSLKKPTLSPFVNDPPTNMHAYIPSYKNTLPNWRFRFFGIWFQLQCLDLRTLAQSDEVLWNILQDKPT